MARFLRLTAMIAALMLFSGLQIAISRPDNISPRANSVGTIPDMVAQVVHNEASIGYETPYILKVHKDKELVDEPDGKAVISEH